MSLVVGAGFFDCPVVGLPALRSDDRSRYFINVRRVIRTSITCLPGTFKARSVSSPRPGGKSIVPSRSGLKSFTNDSPLRETRSFSAPVNGCISMAHLQLGIRELLVKRSGTCMGDCGAL